MIVADVAREDANVILSDLRELEVPERGSIAIEPVDIEISDAAKKAEHAAHGSIAVTWLCTLGLIVVGATPESFSSADPRCAT